MAELRLVKTFNARCCLLLYLTTFALPSPLRLGPSMRPCLSSSLASHASRTFLPFATRRIALKLVLVVR